MAMADNKKADSLIIEKEDYLWFRAALLDYMNKVHNLNSKTKDEELKAHFLRVKSYYDKLK